MFMEKGLYAQVVMICQKDLDNEKKGKITRNITSKGSLQDQYAGLILIVSS